MRGRSEAIWMEIEAGAKAANSCCEFETCVRCDEDDSEQQQERRAIKITIGAEVRQR